MDFGDDREEAIVTGASEGIGKAMTLALARGRRRRRDLRAPHGAAEETAAEIAKATGRKIPPVTADLTKGGRRRGLHQESAPGVGPDRHPGQQCGLSAWRSASSI